MSRFLPLFVAISIPTAFLAATFSARLAAVFSRLAYVLFDGDSVRPNVTRERLLRSAAIGTPYREYVTKTYLYTFGTALASVTVGVYLGAGLLEVFETTTISGPSLLRSVGRSTHVFVVLAATGMVSGAIGGAIAYAARWKLPALRANTRRRQINAGMPRMVAFIYALTRGGMAFPEVLRTLSRNDDVFGEGANEVGVAVRNIDLFNVDLVTAVNGLSQRTPSETFESFSENLSSVLQSGQNLSEFLRKEYERYRETAEDQQEEILQLLATAAEMYVTIVVAGLLFSVTILVIIGLTTGDTLFVLRLIAYVVLPVVNLLFIVYLAEITQPLRASRDDESILEGTTDSKRNSRNVATDGGALGAISIANRDRLRAYERLNSLRKTVTQPLKAAIERPERLLYVTVPIALAVTLYRLPTAFVDGSLDVTVVDDLLVQATLFVIATFAVVYEIHIRRLRRMEAAIPDLLERLASLNEAGVSVVGSFDRIRRSDLGALDDEVDRIWRDIEWGATVSEALERFEKRVRTPAVTRVTTLTTNAMRASNDIGPVLRIASEQARADERLRKKRRQEMLTYLVVIYVSFIVFLVVVVALDSVLIPNLPDAGAFQTDDGLAATPGFVQFDASNRAAYQLVFFHTALLQSGLSGLVGGMMGKGSLKDGLKHATVMLSVTYLVLVVV